MRRFLDNLRREGNRITGGGLRSLGKRALGKTVRRMMANPMLLGLGRWVLTPFPKLTTLLYNLANPTDRYELWVRTIDTISDADRAAIRRHIAGLSFRPVVSIVLVKQSVPSEALFRSLRSIRNQVYPNWEMCAVVETNEQSPLNKLLEDQAATERRIKLKRSKGCSTRADAVNGALECSTGDFVAFLQMGDILPEHSLYEIVVAIGSAEKIEVLYTDGDFIDYAGHRSDPWFKPGWDPDFLLAENYLDGLAVYRRCLLEKIGFLRPSFEGAEFHDLALRATSTTSPDRIRHIPAILHHRGAERKEADSEQVKNSSSVDAIQRAVRDHLNAQGFLNARIEAAPNACNTVRVIWPVPDPEPLVSIIIPTRDRADLLAQCVEGVLHRTDYKNIEVLIVDNSSSEAGTLALFEMLTETDPRVKILHQPGPFNHSAMNNAAAREAKGELLLLLNNDVNVIHGGWLHELVSYAVRPDVGVVGAKLLYADGSVQHGGIVFSPDAFAHVHRLANRYDLGYRNQLALPHTYLAVTGACAMIRRELFFKVGGLDEVNLPTHFNDIDLCLRVRDHSFRIVWTPFAELIHLESASRGGTDSPVKMEIFLQDLQYMRKKWSPLFEAGDPYHNPNVLFTWDHFEIPSTPRRQKPWYDLFEQVRPAGALNKDLTLKR